tara:strand:+ start:31 stop:282 length:252 start_codon:yes stop_codon:yes gene_type:complete
MAEEVKNAEEEQVQLSLQDIATMVQIIDICSRRGGFEGQELEAVGGLRNRVVKFLNANAPKDGDAPQGDIPAAEVDASEPEEG